MNLSSDYIIERKRNKMHLTRWKILSLVLIIMLILLLGKRYESSSNVSAQVGNSSDHIARIMINDVIYDDWARIKRIEKISQNQKTKALIVHINSPGGSVVGSEMLYNSIRKISKNIPVVIIMDSVATSGGYMASLAGNYIIAHNGTITGSIGVLMQSAEITELAEKIGIKFTNFKSGELKANPNLMEKLTPEAHKATMDSIYQVYDYFVNLVAERRNLDIEYVKKLADGRVYSGRQALELKLIDAIGNEDTAIDWLKDKNNIQDLKILDVKLKSHEGFIELLLEDFNSAISGFFTKNFKGLKSIL
jgi:protease IV